MAMTHTVEHVLYTMVLAQRTDANGFDTYDI